MGEASDVPRVLYTYWEGPETTLITLCLQSMARQNPGWKVVVANRSTCEAICGRRCPPAMHNWKQPLVADWFRIQCLAAHGGVWLDASCLCLRPLETWVDMRDSAAIQGFDAPIKKRGILENWALACAPGCLFAKAWAEEMHLCASLGRDEYRRALPAYAHPPWGARRYNSDYFTMHHAALRIMHEHPDFPVTMRPGNAIGGPFDFSHETLQTCISDVMQGRVPGSETNFYKITNWRRRKLCNA